MSASVIMTSVATVASLGRMFGRHLARVVLAAVCVSLVFARAGAEDAPVRTPPSEALEHYNRGRAYYQSGRYREAVVELEHARTLDPSSPNLAYNLARVYELLGEIDHAIANYERYRDMLPASETAERERVTGTVQRLRGAKREVVRPAPEPATPSPAHPVVVRSVRGVADGAFWTLASLSLAALAAGTVTGVFALRAERDARAFVLGEDGGLRDLHRDESRANRLAITTDVLGAGALLGGLTSLLLYSLRSRPVVEPRLDAGPQSGLTLSLRGRL